jgi:hypothetical protein
MHSRMRNPSLSQTHGPLSSEGAYVCPAKLVRSLLAASDGGSFAFISGAITKRADAPTTIEQSMARTGIPDEKVA